jgi:serine/threonine-protein kinase
VLRPGLLLAEKFRIDRALGEGGMGVVYAATDVRLGRPVAVKVIRQGRARRPESRARFAREARVMASLRSRHAVTVYDVGELDDGNPYLVQELVEGESLAERQRRDPLDDSAACAAVADACAALAEAHAAGIVHRDVKPENLLLTVDTDGGAIVKVADFGLALEDDDERLTRTGALVGTARYMAPEQVEAARATDKTDVWALGVVLYELLARRAPFEGATPADLLANIATAEAIPIRIFRSDLPAALADAIDASLKRAGDARPSAAELRARLLPFAAAPRVVPPTPKAAARASERRPRRSPARTLALVAGAALFVGVGGAAATAFFTRSTPKRPEPPPIVRATAAPPDEDASTSADASTIGDAEADARSPGGDGGARSTAAPSALRPGRCECRDFGRLCQQRGAPACDCECTDCDHRFTLHPTEAAALAKVGASAYPVHGWTGPAYEQGQACTGYGALDCSYPCRESGGYDAIHHAPCAGYHETGDYRRGRWYCE